MEKWMEMVKQVGFPIVIALLLMFFYVTQLKGLAQAVEQHVEDMRQLVPLMKQTCLNTAHDADARRGCFGQ